MVFLDKHSTRSPDELLRSREWRLLETILVNFQNLSKQHDIVPLLLYIPGATEIYSRYSTRDSGANWLKVRDALVATSGNNEEAIRKLAAKLGIALIDIRPAFEQAAQEGKLLYYRLDSHWNSEGREIAAEVTANSLRAIDPAKPRRNPSKKENQPGPATQIVKVNNDREVVMTRTIDGTINSWNRNAEQLYGWKKEEVIGKVSHKLLRTQFPEPLEKIDAELLQTGHWSGKLVHATQDGRRVVVESRWVLDPKGHGRTVVEINTRSGDPLISLPAG
jgi:PAS domain S-box-containing protein